MPKTAKLFSQDFLFNLTSTELMREHRARVALEDEARNEKRRLGEAEQSATSSAPEIRVRVWEKIHGLALPADTMHPLVNVIATQTHLTVAEVQHEQLVRKAARP
jgi:hypothetical protein